MVAIAGAYLTYTTTGIADYYDFAVDLVNLYTSLPGHQQGVWDREALLSLVECYWKGATARSWPCDE